MDTVDTDSQPWLDVFKPNSLDQVVGNTTSVGLIKSMIIEKNFQNILLYGPPGSGKTSTLHCIPKYFKDNDVSDVEEYCVKEMNASDKRGFDDVKTLIDPFVSKMYNQWETRIVVLDEVDNMTLHAQRYLSILIDKCLGFFRKCFFILACNSIEKLDESLLSKFLCLKFEKIDSKTMQLSMDEFLKRQSRFVLTRDCDVFWNMVTIHADGDMRVAINLLQACSEFVTDTNQGLSYEALCSVCPIPPVLLCREILKCAREFQLSEAIIKLQQLYRKGYTTSEIAKVLKIVVNDFVSPHSVEATSIKLVFAETELTFLRGCCSILQLESLLVKISKCAKQYSKRK